MPDLFMQYKNDVSLAIRNLKMRGDASEETRDAKHKELVVQNLPLVIRLVREFHPKTDDLRSELIEEGNIGLVRAAQKFDPNRNVKFSDYAGHWIKGRIRKFLRRLRRPRGPVALRRKLVALETALREKTGSEPNNETLTAAFNKKYGTNCSARVIGRLRNSDPSLPAGAIPCTEEKGRTVCYPTLSAYTRRATAPPDDLIIRNAFLRAALSLLGKREETIIILHYMDGCTLREIGLMLSLHPNTVWQIETKALRRIRERLCRHES